MHMKILKLLLISLLGIAILIGFSAAAMPIISHDDAFIVPEPASMLLLGVALIGLASLGRKHLFK